MHPTNVHMAYSPPRTTSWAKKSGRGESLAGPVALLSLRPWETIRRRFLSRGVLAGSGTGRMACQMPARNRRCRRCCRCHRSHQCQKCQTMSVCCSVLCSARAKTTRLKTAAASRISGPPVHQTGTRCSTCRAVQSMGRPSGPLTLAAMRGRPLPAARSQRRGRVRPDGTLRRAPARASTPLGPVRQAARPVVVAR
jgi:hypothetical protein